MGLLDLVHEISNNPEYLKGIEKERAARGRAACGVCRLYSGTRADWLDEQNAMAVGAFAVGNELSRDWLH
jgi:hypothetical protein